MPQNSLSNLHLPLATLLAPQAAASHGPLLPSPALRPGKRCCGAHANGITVPADAPSTNPHPANRGAEPSSRCWQRPLVAEHAKRSRSSSVSCSSLRAPGEQPGAFPAVMHRRAVLELWISSVLLLLQGKSGGKLFSLQKYEMNLLKIYFTDILTSVSVIRT